MSLKTIIAFCLVILTVLLGLDFNSRAQRQATQKQTWEYKITSISDERQLNEFAAQGWELAEVTATEYGSTFYLKRAK